jgi:hypothetical protein
MHLNKIKFLFLLIIITSCNNLTMKDIYKDENLPLKAEGYVNSLEFYKGGNTTLVVKESSGKETRVAVDTLFKQIIKEGDYFIKKANSNKCIVERNDSIIYLDCYDIPKEIRDSLGVIEEWSDDKKGYWHLKR